jgi:hypothetical protein
MIYLKQGVEGYALHFTPPFILSDIPIEFWGEHDEMSRQTIWYAEVHFPPEHHFESIGTITDEVWECYRGRQNLLIDKSWGMLAHALYRKVCEWHGQDVYPLIVSGTTDLKPLNI